MIQNRWKDFFRFGDKFQPWQKEAGERIVKGVDDGEQFIIAQIPTGVGKSDLAMSIAMASGNAYIATGQNILIDQYLKDFLSLYDEKDFYYIKGKINYDCTQCLKCEEEQDELMEEDGVERDYDYSLCAHKPPDHPHRNCKRGDEDARSCPLLDRCRKKDDKFQKALEEVGEDNYHDEDDPDFWDRAKRCFYQIERSMAARAKVALTNIHFYAAMRFLDQFLTRKLVIIDEAHNLPNIIMDMVSLTMSESYLNKLDLITSIPEDFKVEPGEKVRIIDPDDFDVWMVDLKEEVDSEVEMMENLAGFKNKVRETSAVEDRRRGFRAYDRDRHKALEEIQAKIEWYQRSREDDVRWIIDGLGEVGTDEVPKVFSRPLHPGYFAQGILFARQGLQYILLSATYLDLRRFAIELGIKAPSLRLKYPPVFPVANRKIFLMNVAPLNYSNFEVYRTRFMKMIKNIAVKHGDEKGIIHCHTYKIQEAIKEYFKDDPRFLFPKTADEKKAALKFHRESKLPTIIVSPSMYEGVDLKDELGRFNIMMKAPFGDLSDRRTMTRMKEDSVWYHWQMFCKVIQSHGRTTRSMTDHSTSYMLDSNFEKYLTQYKDGKKLDVSLIRECCFDRSQSGIAID